MSHLNLIICISAVAVLRLHHASAPLAHAIVALQALLPMLLVFHS